jgi:hypothetical protein
MQPEGIFKVASGTASVVNAALHHVTGTIVDTDATFVPDGFHSYTTAVHLDVAGGFIALDAPGSYVVGEKGISVFANAGGSYLIGGEGDNVLHGGNTLGSIMIGGTGKTVFEATGANDIIIGGCGMNDAQTLGGGPGAGGYGQFDLMVGGPSGDILEGNNSTAVILGGGGNEYIHAGGDNCTLVGGTNTGTIHADKDLHLSGLTVGDRVNGTGQHATFVYQLGDGVQWIENFNPAKGDTLQVYGFSGPAVTGMVDGFTVLYFGENQAVVFNTPQSKLGIVYHGDQTAMSGAFGHFNPLAPTVLGKSVTSFTGTEGDDIAIGSDAGTTFHGHGGNDYLVGGAGDDVFHLGGGSSWVEGGAGYNVVLLDVGFGAAKTSANADGTFDLFTGTGASHLSHVAAVEFIDGKLVYDAGAKAAQVFRLYQAALDRPSDVEGQSGWTDGLEHGTSLHDLGQAFLDSVEFRCRFSAASGGEDGDFVEQLYRNVLHRDSDAGGKANWVNVLESHAQDRAEVLISFSECAENRENTKAEIEDGVWVADLDAAKIARLYDTVLGRAPDAEGLANWTKALEGKALSLGEVADAFAGCQEFQLAYGKLDDNGFVDALYRNSLRREAEAEGHDTWVKVLEHGASRAEVVLAFSESREHIDLTHGQVFGDGAGHGGITFC